jgi:hypothetical protein
MFGHKLPPLPGLEIDTIYGRKKVKGDLEMAGGWISSFEEPTRVQ